MFLNHTPTYRFLELLLFLLLPGLKNPNSKHPADEINVSPTERRWDALITSVASENVVMVIGIKVVKTRSREVSIVGFEAQLLCGVYVEQ